MFLNVIIILLIIVFLVNVVMFLKEKRSSKPKTYDGKIVITVKENSKKVFSIEDIDPEEIEKKEYVVFKIVSEDIVQNE